MDKEIRAEDLSPYYAEMLRSNLLELEIETPKGKIVLKRVSPEQEVVQVHRAPVVRKRKPEPSSENAPAADSGPLKPITSPIMGIFYRSSSPQSAPFVKEGDTVNPGSTLCIVEAMKVMNEIKSDIRCKIIEIKVENSKPITKGQTLFKVEPL